MTSKVVVRMNTCSKVHKIEVSLRDDGDLDVRIESDCKNVQEYARRLNLISMDDLMDFNKSRIVAPEVREPLSISCLCPMGVFNAGNMEVGMLSKTLARNSRSNDIIFDDD